MSCVILEKLADLFQLSFLLAKWNGRHDQEKLSKNFDLSQRDDCVFQ